MLSSLESAKMRGAKIVSINPLPEVGNFRFKNPQDLKNPLRAGKVFFGDGTKLSDLWLPLRINGDVAVLQGIMKEMLAEEEKRPGSVFDLEFIREYTIGFEEFVADLRAASWDDIVVSSGVTRHEIRAAAEIAIQSKRIICCWAMGLTQHKNAVATIQEIINFLLLGGNIGRPGTGPCPVRGHSNVQGDRTMGIWERMNAKFLDKLAAEFHFAPPREHGTDTVETIKQMHDGRIRVFVGMGGIFFRRRLTRNSPLKPCNVAGSPRTFRLNSTGRILSLVKSRSFCRALVGRKSIVRRTANSLSPWKIRWESSTGRAASWSRRANICGASPRSWPGWRARPWEIGRG
jgi:hypothetical protein